jgi:3D (Asp-Asp-Asp) domain-containing protein
VTAAADPLAASESASEGGSAEAFDTTAGSDERPLGTFRNTYYNFPDQRHYRGDLVKLFDSRCELIAHVPRKFHDTVCVQGSGVLESGRTVSFARRDCSCARRCPRSAQHICFEVLDEERFPWGRGAMGSAITPLLSVAVDSAVIPLGSSLFIPEYVGLPRDTMPASTHDGCFLAQDRGIQVRGQHVDVFTGTEATTRRWNELVPTYQGVTVFLDSPRCRRPE